MLKRANATIFHRNRRVASRIERVLHRFSFPFEIRHQGSTENYVFSRDSPEIVFLEERGAESDELKWQDIARSLKKEQENLKIILLEKEKPFDLSVDEKYSALRRKYLRMRERYITKEAKFNALKNKLIDGCVGEDFSPDRDFEEFSSQVDPLLPDIIKQKISLLVIGLGGYGLSVVKKAKNLSGVEEIDAFTNFVHGDYTAMKRNIGDSINPVRFYKRLEDALQRYHDLILISTAEYIREEEYLKYKSRNDLLLLNRLADGSKEKIHEILSLILKSGFRGGLNIATNPVWFHSMVALEDFGFEPTQIFAASPGTMRSRRITAKTLTEVYHLLYGESGAFPYTVEIRDIKGLYALGCHGADYPVFANCTVGGVPFRRIPGVIDYKRKLDGNIEEEIRHGVIEEGLKSRITADEFKTYYDDAPESFMGLIDHVSEGRRAFSEPIQCMIGGVMTGYPASAAYTDEEIPKIRVIPDSSYNLKEIDARLYMKILNQKKFERAFTRAHRIAR